MYLVSRLPYFIMGLTFCKIFGKIIHILHFVINATYMIKVTDTVLDLIQTDELALETLRAGLLNLSAYAEKIHQQVENATKKPVQKGTIVVALSRIARNLPDTPLLHPDVTLTNLGIKSALTVLTYKKTADMQRKISVMNPFILGVNELFAVTEGQEEITIICEDGAKDLFTRHAGFNIKPKAQFNDVVAITASLKEDDILTPNMLYTLLRALAVKKINVIELVSTYSEISFIVKKEDMETALSALNVYFANKK